MRVTSVGARKGRSRLNRPSSSKTPSSKTEETDMLLAEAQFALGKAAVYNNDPTVALQHFSQVSTPQAAWNQVQVGVVQYSVGTLHILIIVCTDLHALG